MNEWITIGHVGVDSGSLMIGDPCYNIDEEWNQEMYDALATSGLFEKSFTELENNKGVVFSSGLGDGIYEVQALFKDYKEWGRRIKEVKIILIDDEEMDDE